MDGTWELKGEKLTISLTSQTNLVGGKFVYDYAYGYLNEDGKLEKETISPPFVREYDLTDLHYDYDVHSEYYREEEGKYLTVHIGGAQFWKLDATPQPLN